MPRTYNSDLRTERAQRNRLQVLDVATATFCERGWATTMADVATRSGLTRQTVYQQFPNKLALLDACIDHALSGGEGVPVRNLDDYRLMGVGDTEERMLSAARWLGGAHERSAVIQNVLDQAAATDSVAAERLRVREQNRWNEVKWAMSLVVGAEPSSRSVDAAWLLASRRNWLVLVGERGWSTQDWAAWFVDHLRTDLRS